MAVNQGVSGLFGKSAGKLIPIHIVAEGEYKNWIKKQPQNLNNWLASQNFKAEKGRFVLLPGAKGAVESVLVIANDLQIWTLASLPMQLPEGNYKIENDKKFAREKLTRAALGWALGSYQFTKYKKSKRNAAQLQMPAGIDAATVLSHASAIYMVRDMVTTPAEDMGPEDIEKMASGVAKEFGAKMRVIRGHDLLKQNYPMIHAVGRAGPQAPRLIDFSWGNPKHKKLTLVGKGVAFDTGGLDLKNASGMELMKKDMAGSAHALALASMIMAAKMPVRLRVLIPAVENSVSSNSFRPLDVFKTRKGITVEIGNTDAEGRLILCDALYEAATEKPDLIIDFATLTGAARVALGPEVPALFTNRKELSQKLLDHAEQENDPLWPLPLWQGYRPWLDSKIADMNNAPNNGYAGAITAALYLESFVENQAWMHLDLMGWNPKDQPGRPMGGEAMTIRALYSLLQDRYG